MLSNEPLVDAMLEPPGEPSAPRETAVDGESGTVAEIEHVEVMFLRFVFVERRASERGLDPLPLGRPTPPPTMTYWRGLLATFCELRLYWVLGSWLTAWLSNGNRNAWETVAL